MGLGDLTSPLYLVGGPQDTLIPTANLTAQNASPTGPAIATAGSIFPIPTNGKATAAFQVTANTLNVALQVYGSNDGINFVAIGGSPLLNQSTARWQGSITAGQTGVFTVNCADFSYVRLSTPNVATTGSASMVGEAGTSPAIVTAEAPQYNSVRATASLLAKTGAGVLHSLSVAALTATPTAGLLTIWDSLSATGTTLYTEWVPAGVLPHTLTLDISFVTGCFIGFDGTLANAAATAALL